MVGFDAEVTIVLWCSSAECGDGSCREIRGTAGTWSTRVKLRVLEKSLSLAWPVDVFSSVYKTFLGIAVTFVRRTGFGTHTVLWFGCDGCCHGRQ